MCRDVEHKRRLGVNPQVDAEVIENSGWVERLARNVAPAELRPEAGGIDQGAGGDVVGMRVLPVGGEDDPRAELPKHPRQCPPALERVFQRAIRQIEVAPPVEPQHLGRRLGFGGPQGERPVRGWLATGQLNHPGLPAAGPRPEQCPGGANFGIIGVRGDHQQIEGDGGGQLRRHEGRSKEGFSRDRPGGRRLARRWRASFPPVDRWPVAARGSVARRNPIPSTSA